MAIVINGSGTVTGLSVGGLPDGTVDAGTLATNSVDSAELVDGAVDDSHIAALAASKLTGALPAISGASLTTMPTGSVLQVVQQVFQTFTQISNSSSYVETGVTKSITPSATSSKILVICSMNISTNSATHKGLQCRLQRGTTIIRPYDNICASTTNVSGNYSITFLDYPSTTSSITYHTLMKSTSSEYFRINNYNSSSGDAASTITLMEIAG